MDDFEVNSTNKKLWRDSNFGFIITDETCLQPHKYYSISLVSGANVLNKANILAELTRMVDVNHVIQ